VAGMLRSFDYAAHHSGNAPWAARHRDAYCAGYAGVLGADPREQPVLVRGPLRGPPPPGVAADPPVGPRPSGDGGHGMRHRMRRRAFVRHTALPQPNR
jgi:hypothetical protein